MPKVLVAASYTPSLLNFRGPLLRALRAHGHEVVACSPDPDEESVRGLADLGVAHEAFPLQRAGMNPLADWASRRALRGIMQRVRPDHVLAYTIKPVIWGSLAARQAGVPHRHALITGLGTAFQEGGLRQRALNGVVSALYRRALAACETVFFQNPDDRDLFVERGLVDAARIHVLNGSGIDVEHFAAAPVPEGGPVFLLVARLIAEKGVRVYAEAARRLKAEYPEAVFRLVGYFEEHPRSIRRRDVEEWVRSGAIEYLGPTDDVRPHLAGCTVYCLPSYYREGVPRSILEALAVGRAIVTTDAPGCRETVVGTTNGRLVRPRDTDSLVAALREFCEDPARARAAGAASRRLAEERFEVGKVNAEMLGKMGLD